MNGAFATARLRAARALPVRWLWLVLPAVMLYRVPSETWVQRVTSVGSLHLQTSELALAAFALFCLVGASSRQFKRAWQSGFGWPWVLYLGALAISTAFAVNKQLALVEDVMVLAGVLLALTVWWTVVSAEQMRAALAIIVIAGVAVTITVVVIVVYAQATPPYPCPDSGVCRGAGLNIRAVQIGGFLYPRGEVPGIDYNRTGMQLVLATLAALYLSRTSSGRRRWFWTATAFIVFGGMLLTLSKGALLSFSVGFIILLFAGWYRLLHLAVAVVVVVAGLTVTQLLVPIAYRALSIFSFIPHVNRFLVSQGTLDTSDRVTLAQNSLDFFRARPILGVGPLNLQGLESVQGLSSAEHNVYIAALAETGVVGFAALLAVLATPVAMVGAALRAAKRLDVIERRAGHLLLAGLVALLVNFLVAPIDYSYWTWVGLTGAWLARSTPDLRLLSLVARRRAASSPLPRAPLPTP